MKKKKLSLLAAILLVVSQFGVYAQMNNNAPSGKATVGGALKAICVLYGTQGNTVSGTITFTPTSAGVKVVADIEGLSKGRHGFHIHEFGDCSAPDGSAAGGHFNPGAMDHGGPMDMTRHMGDMGNLDADETGKAHLEYVDPMISLSGDHSIIGRSVIIHKGEDDMKTQPTGNSGPRIACGVIGLTK